jgi:hypothetical protein
MALVTPFWFKQRQAKAEDAGPDLVRVTGPNMKEAILGIRKADTGKWAAYMRWTADGPEVYATGPDLHTAYDAWEAAFEIYRKQAII